MQESLRNYLDSHYPDMMKYYKEDEEEFRIPLKVINGTLSLQIVQFLSERHKYVLVKTVKEVMKIVL